MLEASLLPLPTPRLSSDTYQQLWDMAHYTQEVPMPPSPRKLVRGNTPLARDPNVPNSPPRQRWTRSVGHIQLSQLAAFRIPEPPQQLTSAAACIPPPKRTPRAMRRTPREPSDEVSAASPRAWHPRPVVWNPAAGRFTVEVDKAAAKEAAAAAAAAATAAAAAAAARAPPAAPPTTASTLPVFLYLPTLNEPPVHVSAAEFARSMHEGSGEDQPIGALLPLPVIASPRGGATVHGTPRARRDDADPPVAHGTGMVGSVRLCRPRPTPRRDRVTQNLRCGHNDDGPTPLPPLPAPGAQLSRVDEQVLAAALSDPAHAVTMAMELRGHVGLSRLGQRAAERPPMT